MLVLTAPGDPSASAFDIASPCQVKELSTMNPSRYPVNIVRAASGKCWKPRSHSRRMTEETEADGTKAQPQAVPTWHLTAQGRVRRSGSSFATRCRGHRRSANAHRDAL